MSFYEGARCDGCDKSMSEDEAAHADNVSEFIWFCYECLNQHSVIVPDEEN